MDTIRSVFKGSAVTSLALCAFLGAAIYSKDAHAVDNLCLPTSQMKQHLNNMGQYSLIAFEHKGSDSKKNLFSELFTLQMMVNKLLRFLE